jgi:outer membrane lipoprotein-sorting protein
MLTLLLLIAGMLCAGVLPLGAQEIPGEPSGREIAIKVDQREDGNDQVSRGVWTLVNEKGQKRVRDTLRYWKDYDGREEIDTKTFIYFNSPPDVKDTTFLNWSYENPETDDDQWIYLPALRKVRRIASGDKENSFMGSDLIFDDLGDRQVDEDEHKLVRVENENGTKLYVVEAVAKKPDYIYSKKLTWVNAEQWTVPKIEFYDRKGRLLKVMHTEWMQVDGIWNWKHTVVENQLTGHRTEIEISDVKMNQGLDDNLFTERSLRTGAP